jgi:hypothetical protein
MEHCITVQEGYHIAEQHQRNEDFVNAAKSYRKAAAKGHALSQNNLGVCYNIGEGVECDTIQAMHWFAKASHLGLASAQFNLGMCYEISFHDFSSAVEWYTKAAMQEDANAQNRLGLCYEAGNGVDQDEPMAVYWYHKAALQGDEDAMDNLSGCYEEGVGVARDLSKAEYWMAKFCSAQKTDVGNFVEDKAGSSLKPFSTGTYAVDSSPITGNNDSPSTQNDPIAQETSVSNTCEKNSATDKSDRTPGPAGSTPIENTDLTPTKLVGQSRKVIPLLADKIFPSVYMKGQYRKNQQPFIDVYQVRPWKANKVRLPAMPCEDSSRAKRLKKRKVSIVSAGNSKSRGRNVRVHFISHQSVLRPKQPAHSDLEAAPAVAVTSRPCAFNINTRRGST